jgi:hypothetical protein
MRLRFFPRLLVGGDFSSLLFDRVKKPMMISVSIGFGFSVSVFRFRFFGFGVSMFRFFDRFRSIDRSGARATLETSFFVELVGTGLDVPALGSHSFIHQRGGYLCASGTCVRACVDINLDGTNKERYGANRTGADDGIDGRKERIRPTAGDEKKRRAANSVGGLVD